MNSLSMLAVAVLAAGKGTRMKSTLPKVLQTLAGVCLIDRVLDAFKNLKADQTLLVVGHQSEEIKKHLIRREEVLEFILQQPQKGTGHAIQQLIPVLKHFQGDLLVLNGDVPLLNPNTLKKLVNAHRSTKADVTALTARLDEPKGYGRVFTSKNNQIESIIEDKDCDKSQLLNNLTNAGIYCFKWSSLLKVLPQLTNNNKQAEFYLTDTISMLPLAMQLEVENTDEVYGINNRYQLAKCEELLQERLRENYMNEGVTFIDPSSCTLSEDCLFGKDVVIEPQTHLRGMCKFGNKCHIGPGSFLEDATIGDNSNVIYSVLKKVKIGQGVTIGPFAHLRPETEVADNSRIGNFVEIKKAFIGESSKINHLSYIGDAQLGNNINIGAGTITANYDGINKHRTIIGDGSKTGANSVLVAPIVLGLNVTVGAGSTLTKNVPDNALALGRNKQLIKSDWPGPIQAQE